MKPCELCETTGLVPGTRKSLEDGKWIDIPTKYRKTCPACGGSRVIELGDAL